MKMIMKFNKEKVKLICLVLVLFSIVCTSNVYATTVSLDVELTDEYLEKELNGLNRVACKIMNNQFAKKPKDSNECCHCQYRMICGGI